MHSMASDDTEITLGVGKLLGLFFLLAAICGIFFSIGYSLGKSSGREQALNDQPAPTTVSADTESTTSSDPKPSAAVTAKSESQAPPSDEASNGAAQQGNLTFYNAVKQKDNAAPACDRHSAACPGNPGSEGCRGCRSTCNHGHSDACPTRGRCNVAYLAGHRTGNHCGADCGGFARR